MTKKFLDSLVGIDVDEAAKKVVDNGQKAIKVKTGSAMIAVLRMNSVILSFNSESRLVEKAKIGSQSELE